MKLRETGDKAANDHHLLTLAKRGDEAAFITLFHRHQAPLFRFVMHMCGSREIAEEVTQDIFLTLLSKETNYSDAIGDLQGFMIGMARNQLRKRLRRTRRTCNLDEVPEAAATPEVLESISREQEFTALKVAILRLPPRYREVIVLCEIQGFDLARASEQLGCALGTVKSRLNRARTILRARLRAREGCPA
jgi:RNA polymerase sigma-70 factor (ECF subfamily)